MQDKNDIALFVFSYFKLAINSKSNRRTPWIYADDGKYMGITYKTFKIVQKII